MRIRISGVLGNRQPLSKRWNSLMEKVAVCYRSLGAREVGSTLNANRSILDCAIPAGICRLESEVSFCEWVDFT